MEDKNSDKRLVTREFTIPIAEIYSDFEVHLNTENNARVMFSAKYGAGKTYFLKQFFADKDTDYDAYHIYPINYLISANEDIVEFLKYDLLVELYKKNPNIFKPEDYNSFVDVQSMLYLWGSSKFLEILKTGVSLIPKLGKPLQESIGLVENFIEFRRKIESGEKGTADEYLAKIKERKINESDVTSELIKNKIIDQKGNKKSVLIIDDLDRIDPEHIFRFLNIFSAHFEIQGDEISNKFNFDKIILVADVRNIQGIFHHKYGDSTDFSGYFDKFYSFEIFEFRNDQIINKVIDKILSEYKIEDIDIRKGAMGESGFIRIIIRDVLIRSLTLTGKQKLNLRQLLKGTRFHLKAFKTGTYIKNLSNRNKSIQQCINLSILALMSLFGGLKDDLLPVLTNIASKIVSNNKPDRLYCNFSESLLMALSPFDEEPENLSHGWGKYSIGISKGKIQRIGSIVARTSSQTETGFVNLFYDLLIEYVDKDLFLKEIEDF